MPARCKGPGTPCGLACSGPRWSDPRRAGAAWLGCHARCSWPASPRGPGSKPGRMGTWNGAGRASRWNSGTGRSMGCGRPGSGRRSGCGAGLWRCSGIGAKPVPGRSLRCRWASSNRWACGPGSKLGRGKGCVRDAGGGTRDDRVCGTRTGACSTLSGLPNCGLSNCRESGCCEPGCALGHWPCAGGVSGRAETSCRSGKATTRTGSGRCEFKLGLPWGKLPCRSCGPGSRVASTGRG